MAILNPQTILTIALSTAFFSSEVTLQLSYILSVHDDAPVGGIVALLSPTWYSLSYALGFFVGSLSQWLLSAIFNLGRKPVLYLNTLLRALACIIEISKLSLPEVLAGSTISGLADGGLWVTAILWQVEMAEDNRRGRRVLWLFISAAAGDALGQWLAYACQVTNTSWRTPIGLQFIFIFLVFVALYFTDESWRWLLSTPNNQSDRAYHIYRRFNPQLSDSDAYSQFQTIRAHTRQAVTYSTLNPWSVYRKSESTSSSFHPYRRLLLGVTLQATSTLSGVPIASYYMTTFSSSFFTNPSGTSALAFLTGGIATILSILYIPTYFLIDKPPTSTSTRNIFTPLLPFGRRRLLILSYLGMSLTFLIPLILAATAPHALRDNANPSPPVPSSLTPSSSTSSSTPTNLNSPSTSARTIAYFTFFLLTYLFTSLGSTPLSHLITAEIAASPSATTRTATVTLALTVRTSLTVMLYFVLPAGIEEAGWRFWAVWMVADLMWAGVTWCVVPEGGLKGLEEVDEVWREGEGRWVVPRGLRERRGEGEGKPVNDEEEMNHAVLRGGGGMRRGTGWSEETIAMDQPRRPSRTVLGRGGGSSTSVLEMVHLPKSSL